MLGARAHPLRSHHYLSNPIIYYGNTEIQCMTMSNTNVSTQFHHTVFYILFMIIYNNIMISLVTLHLFINSVHTKHHKRIFYTFLEFFISRIFKFWGNIVQCTILTTFKWAPDCTFKLLWLTRSIRFFMSLVLWLRTKPFVGRITEFDIKRSKTFIEMTVSPYSFLNNGLKWNLERIPKIVKLV